MTNKDRAIQACRELAEKYRNPQGKRFFSVDNCNLCDIHFVLEKSSEEKPCTGCPLSNEDQMGGCSEFESATKARKQLPGLHYPNSSKTDKTFIARAEFFDKIIPILEKIPAARFTKSGWTYFKELDRTW